MGVTFNARRITSKISSMSRLLLTTLFVLGFISSRKIMVRCAYQDKVHVQTETDADELHRKWHAMENMFLQTSESLVKTALPMLVRMSSEVEISTECTAAVLKTVSALKEGKLWAYKMIDATGKPMGGQLSGTTSFYGSYSQCLNVTAINPWSPTKTDFKGKYCLARLRPALPEKPHTFTYGQELPGLHNLTLKTEFMQHIKESAPAFYSYAYQVALCVPSVCSDEDINQVSIAIANKLGWNSELYSCETSETKTHMDKDQIAVTIIIALLIGLVTIATTLETFGRKYRKQFNYDKFQMSWKLVRAFSMRLNTKKIFNTNGPEDQTLSALNGMKFLSIGWVVVIHVYSLLSPLLYREGIRAVNMATTFSFQLITSGSLSVDTFFFITGLLVSYQIVKLVDTKGMKCFNVPIIVLRRLWRLLPSAMMTLGLIVILPLMNSGPVWKDETEALLRPTRKNWWSVLTCVANFLPFDQMPMVSIWYISADVQLFLMAIVILAIMFRHEAASYTLMVGLAVASVMTSGIVIYCTKSLPIFLLTAPDKDIIYDQFYYGHTLPHNHVSVYIIGMGLGIYFARSSKPTIPTWSVLVGWPVALALMATALFSAHVFTDGGVPSALDSFFFAASYRTLWALGLAIMTFMCATRNGGFINDFLSWKAFVPLNRLTYLVYLLHILFIVYFHGSLRGVIDIADHINVWISVGTLGLTLVGAYFMKILFEAPVAELEKLLFEKLFMGKAKDSNKEITVQIIPHHIVVLPAVTTLAAVALPQITISTKV